MALPITGVLDAVQSHALKLGIFERVRLHEPKNAPGAGLSAAVWVDSVTPVRSSGLASSSVRLALSVRLYASMLKEPQDAIDRDLTGALDLLMGAYSGAFTLDGQLRHVDLLGAHGDPLAARAGYLEIDRKLFRVFTITLPLIINDAWNQEA